MRTGNIYLHPGGTSPNNTRNADFLSNIGGTLNWTGAATFASSVSAVGGNFSSNVNFTASNGNYFTLNNGTHNSIQIFQQSSGYGFYNNVNARNDLQVFLVLV